MGNPYVRVLRSACTHRTTFPPPPHKTSYFSFIFPQHKTNYFSPTNIRPTFSLLLLDKVYYSIINLQIIVKHMWSVIFIYTAISRTNNIYIRLLKYPQYTCIHTSNLHTVLEQPYLSENSSDLNNCLHPLNKQEIPCLLPHFPGHFFTTKTQWTKTPNKPINHCLLFTYCTKVGWTRWRKQST